MYSYEANGPGELTVQKGDLIHCKEQDRNGWVKGTNDNTKEEGWCPASYRQKVMSTRVSAWLPVNGIRGTGNMYHHYSPVTDRPYCSLKLIYENKSKYTKKPKTFLYTTEIEMKDSWSPE